MGHWGPKFLRLAESTGRLPGIGGHRSILGCDPTEYLPELENQEISRLLQLSWTLHLYVSPTVHSKISDQTTNQLLLEDYQLLVTEPKVQDYQTCQGGENQ